MDEELAVLFDEASKLNDEAAKLNAKIAAKLRQKKPEPKPATGKSITPTEWMTAREYCATFKIGRTTLQEMKKQNRVQVLDLGGKTRRYRSVV